MSAPALALNPWRSAWTRPRETIQAIVDSNPEYQVYALAALAGLSQALDRASTRHLGDELSLGVILAIVAIAGPIGGIIGWYISSALLGWTGKWIGGAGSYQNIRAAVAWSSVPVIVSLLLLVPELWLFGKDLFTTETPRIDANLFGYISLICLEIALAIWAFVLFLKMLGQVQGFSAWRSLGNVSLIVLVILVPVIVLAIAISVFLK